MKSLIAALALALSLLAPSFAQAKAKKAPSVATIKNILRDQYASMRKVSMRTLTSKRFATFMGDKSNYRRLELMSPKIMDASKTAFIAKKGPYRGSVFVRLSSFGLSQWKKGEMPMF